eukprot:jgi/Chrzof1/2352/Cz11g11290.t1
MWLLLQFGASIAVVDCHAQNEELWQQRLSQRALTDRGSDAAHKPQSWQQLQDMIDRYDGCWQWSVDGSVCLKHHIQVDTTASPATDTACQVVDWMQQQVMPSLHISTI